MNFYNFDECVLLDNKRKDTVKIEPTEISIDTFGVVGATEIEIRGVLRDYDWRPNSFRLAPVRQRIDYSKMYGAMFWEMPKIKDVIFNDPATIVFWADGTKTVVKCQEDDIFDPEKGLVMAISKKALGNKGNYCNEIKKWLPKLEKDEEEIAFTKSFGEAISEVVKKMNDAARNMKGADGTPKQIRTPYEGDIKVTPQTERSK